MLGSLSLLPPGRPRLGWVAVDSTTRFTVLILKCPYTVVDNTSAVSSAETYVVSAGCA